MAVAAGSSADRSRSGYRRGVTNAVQSTRDGGCVEWRACRELALAAAERGEYENFHDLAWRAVQTGPPKDPSLMYLLARAQALSGRPHDALIMLQRLAEMGVTPRTSRVRELATDGFRLRARPARTAPAATPAGRPPHRRPPPCASGTPSVGAVAFAPRFRRHACARNTSRPFLDQTVCGQRPRL